MKVKILQIHCHSHIWHKTISLTREGIIKERMLKLYYETSSYCFSIGFLWLMGELEKLKTLEMSEEIDALQKAHTDSIKRPRQTHGLNNKVGKQQETQKCYLPESYQNKYKVEEKIVCIQDQDRFESELRENKNVMIILIVQDGMDQRKHALTIRDNQTDGFEILDTNKPNNPFKRFKGRGIEPVIDYLNESIINLQETVGKDNLYIRVVKYLHQGKRKLTELN
ncbi:MAG: hypothetical protein VW397_08115 [Candidatus Margulisiibacteriota bacterium]